jgi:hypothetical protein
MELITGLSLSLFGGSGHGYSHRNPQPSVVVNILPPPCNCRACRGAKKKKKKIKKKKLYSEVGRRYPMENDAIRSHAHPWLTNDYHENYCHEKHQMSATATGARGNNTSTYCRRTRQVYESEEEIDEEEESESDDESEESDDEDEEEDESDGEETVHQLPAGRGRGSPEEHLRFRRAYY